MLFFLLFSIFLAQPCLLWSASVAFNHIPNAQQSTKSASSVFKSTDLDETDEPEEQSYEMSDDEDEDEFYTSLKNKTSFRTKLLRTFRSIKRYSTILIVSLAVCAVGYVYWYKLWPFSTTLVPPESENSETIDTKKTIQEPEPLQENIAQLPNKLDYEELHKISSDYETPAHLNDLRKTIKEAKNKILK